MFSEDNRREQWEEMVSLPKKDFSASNNIAIVTAFMDVEINLDVLNFKYILNLDISYRCFSMVLRFVKSYLKISSIKCYYLRKWASENQKQD